MNDKLPARPANEGNQSSLPGDPAARRTFLKQVAGTGAALTLGSDLLTMETSCQAADATGAPTDADSVEVRLFINGKAENLRLDPRVTVLDAVREQLRLTGTKKGCDHGQCGVAEHPLLQRAIRR